MLAFGKMLLPCEKMHGEIGIMHGGGRRLEPNNIYIKTLDIPKEYTI